MKKRENDLRGEGRGGAAELCRKQQKRKGGQHKEPERRIKSKKSACVNSSPLLARRRFQFPLAGILEGFLLIYIKRSSCTLHQVRVKGCKRVRLVTDDFYPITEPDLPHQKRLGGQSLILSLVVNICPNAPQVCGVNKIIFLLLMESESPRS